MAQVQEIVTLLNNLPDDYKKDNFAKLLNEIVIENERNSQQENRNLVSIVQQKEEISACAVLLAKLSNKMQNYVSLGSAHSNDNNNNDVNEAKRNVAVTVSSPGSLSSFESETNLQSKWRAKTVDTGAGSSDSTVGNTTSDEKATKKHTWKLGKKKN